MLGFKRISGIAAAALLASAVGAQASPWTITGGSGVALPGGGGQTAFNPAAPGNIPAGIGVGTVVTAGGTLSLAVDALSLVYGYLGKEAGAANAALATPGGNLFTNAGTSILTVPVAGPVSAGILNFSLTTDFEGGGSIANGSAGVNPGSRPPQIAFYLPSVNSARVYWFFDDGGIGSGTNQYPNCSSGDCDFDDMYGYIDAVPIPLPAAAWLLIAGVGGLGLVARRRKTSDA